MSFKPFVITAQDGDVWKFNVDNRCMRSFDVRHNLFSMAFAYLYAASATYRHDCLLATSFEDFCDKILPCDSSVMVRAGEVKAQIESFFAAFAGNQIPPQAPNLPPPPPPPTE